MKYPALYARRKKHLGFFLDSGPEKLVASASLQVLLSHYDDSRTRLLRELAWKFISDWFERRWLDLRIGLWRAQGKDVEVELDRAAERMEASYRV